MQKTMTGELPPPPIAMLIGFTLRTIEPGRAVVDFTAEPRHAHPMGTLHGGVLCDIADVAMGSAYASTLDEGESFTTIDLQINFLRPVRTAHLTADASIVQRGRTIGMTECTITDEQGRLVAKASATCMTLRGEQARGR